MDELFAVRRKRVSAICDDALKMGVRELDLVTQYTVHPYDEVLGLYFAQARMYDAGDRRFAAADPVKGSIVAPNTIAQYTYCLDNPFYYIDPLGLASVATLNFVGWGLSLGIPNSWALSLILLDIGQSYLAGHQLAQVFAYKHLSKRGFDVELEVTLPYSGKRADVVASKGESVYIFELKHYPIPFAETYQAARGKTANRRATNQLQDYYDLLDCYINKNKYNLNRNYGVYETIEYTLFSSATIKKEAKIHLRFYPNNLVDYWFTVRDTSNPDAVAERVLSPQLANDYSASLIMTKLQEDAYKRLAVGTGVVALTAGVVVAGALIGLVSYCTAEIAVWAAGAVTDATISTGATIATAIGTASQVVYSTGDAIKQIITRAPRIEGLLVG